MIKALAKPIARAYLVSIARRETRAVNTYFFQNRTNGEVKSVKASEFKTALTKYHFKKGWEHIWTYWA